MSLSSSELEHLAGLATGAALEAGRFIARSRPETIEHKPGGQSLASQVVTEVDRHSQDLILKALAPTFESFDLGVLTEEREDDRQRLEKDYFWCIDPLDGTLPFIESTPGYAVSIALLSRDGTPQIGVVFDPVEHTLYRAVLGQGIVRNDQTWTLASCPPGTALSLFMDRSFKDVAGYERIVESLQQLSGEMGLSGLEIRATGGAVMNACEVLTHPPAGYFKLPKPQDGGGSLWDFAATACLFHEAGAVATDIHGGRLDLNRADSTFMNHRGILFATSPELARGLMTLRSELSSPS